MIQDKNINLKDNEKIELTNVILDRDELVNHAVEISKQHKVNKRKNNIKPLILRLENNFNIISSVYKMLNDVASDKKNLSSAAEWLLDNFYKIEEQIKVVKLEMKRDKFTKLPILENGFLKGYPRIYCIALELVSHTDAKIDEKILADFVKSYQSISVLSISEIWSLSLMVRIALVEKIRNVSEKIYKNQVAWAKVEEMDFANFEGTMEFIKNEFASAENIDHSFIEHFLRRLRQEGYEIGKSKDYIEKLLLEYNSSIDELIKLEHQEQAKKKISIGNAVISLNVVSTLDWNDIFEDLCVVDSILRLDNADIYSKMDFDSRDYYRYQIEKLAKKCNVSEVRIARKCLELSKISQSTDIKRKHVGYYIMGKGRKELFNSYNIEKRYDLNEYPISYYLGSICLVTALIIFLMIHASFNSWSNVTMLIVAIAVAIIPASEIAISFINAFVANYISPSFIAKLDYEKGVPDESATMVIIPTLLANVKATEELLEKLEAYYHANKDENIYFALVGDFKDGQNEEEILDEEIKNFALKRVRQLNEKYGQNEEKFFYLNRKRIYCDKEKKYMGWERKRGAILEFNDYLQGDINTNFTVVSSEVRSISKKIRYIITIDADTNLGLDNAKRLIGAIAHPLNNAVLNKEEDMVTEGYGIIQPRIALDIEASNNSLFTKIFAGQGGIDPYTTAISDVYQDLFGEGIFTGKGIYDVEIFNKVSKKGIPEYSVLSHDLIESCYLRTGLATDIELIDGHPGKYSSYMMRLHRWVRGDWQLIKWLGMNCKISSLSKWKITDNLRRSLVSVLQVISIFFGLIAYSENWFSWIAIVVISLCAPLIVDLISLIFNSSLDFKKYNTNGNKITGIKSVFYLCVLQFVFLPYKAVLMLDAIIRTLYRVFISKKNLLEWVTAADIESKIKNDLGVSISKMKASIIVPFILMVSVYIYNPSNLIYSIIIGVIWMLSPYISFKISMEEKKYKNLCEIDLRGLRRISRKTWLYYEQFSSKEDNYLPPDNFQEDPPNGIAHRTSPTNIGFLLIATVGARDFGYITTSQMFEKIDNTISTVMKLDMWKGHLYNWYDTTNLSVLRPQYVSTVDSGNFVGYLITLKEGLKEYKRRKLIDRTLLNGIKDSIAVLSEKHEIYFEGEAYENEFDFECVNKFALSLLDQIKTEDNLSIHFKDMLNSLIYEIKSYFIKCDDIDETMFPNIKNRLRKTKEMSLDELSQEYDDLLSLINKTTMNNNQNNRLYLENLKPRIEESNQAVKSFLNRIDALICKVETIIENTDFAHLYDVKRNLFSIGYDVKEEKLTNSYYDLLASEARLVSYIAIAKKQVSKRHWYKLGRALSLVDGYRGLVSWTATMFEYLMPPLIMKNYSNTILDETYKTMVMAQKKYGEKRHLPWGTSESGYYGFDINLNYQYKAFGVPDLGLKRGLAKDMVISPYSTILAVNIDDTCAMYNLRRLISEGAEGEYGLYEAIDYTLDRLPSKMQKMIVKSYMAHHQGMSFIALNNYINGDVMQRRFHSDPVMRSAEILLQERIPVRAIVTKQYKEAIGKLREVVKEDVNVVRSYDSPRKALPHCHILSNGKYTVLMTDKGNGYSKKEEIQITRWREDLTTNSNGSYIFIKNLNTNTIWSNSLSPIDKKPDSFNINFLQDKVEFARVDKDIDTHTEIIVSPEDDVEIRKVTLTNHSNEVVMMEVSSYFETILTSHPADIAHPAFSNLFIRTEPIFDTSSIIASRRPRMEHHKTVWMVHGVTVDGEVFGNFEYETNRSNFVGRTRNISNAIALNQPLTNSYGPILDPIMSIRKKLKIEPGNSATISYYTGISDNKENVIKISRKYCVVSSINRAFELAKSRSQVENSYLNFTAKEIKTYQDLVPHLVFLSPTKRKFEKIISENTRGQSSLWAYGISGDLPIILVTIRNMEDIDIVIDALKAHEYLKIKGLNVDLVILNQDESSYLQPLQQLLNDTVCSKYGSEMLDRSAGVFIRNANLMNKEDVCLLYSVARVVLEGDNGAISSQIKLNNSEKDLGQKLDVKVINREFNYKDEELDLEFSNGYGGFKKDSKEYVIRLKENINTPAPWINVIANKNFGFVVSEIGSGFTWAENSRENKITSWSNDPVTDPPSEIMYIRDDETGEIWTPVPAPIRNKESYTITHGFGYSNFEHNCNGIHQSLTVFVPQTDSVKINILKIKNEGKEKRSLSFVYYLRPVMGVSDQNTQQFIKTKMIGEYEGISIENPYNADFAGRISFVSSSEKIQSFTCSREEFIGFEGSIEKPKSLEYKDLSNTCGIGYDGCVAIKVSLDFMANEEKEIVFLLGQAKKYEDIQENCIKYKNIDFCKASLVEAKESWDNIFEKVQIKTPDLSMDILLNKWLIYQNVSCRMWARSAFYQSGGAYGYRDQLQDSMNALMFMPEATRKQILIHCAHQFLEGDVQHWWHPGAGEKGIRTKFSDDLLWLPFVTCEYVQTTGDYEVLKEEVNFLQDKLLGEEEDERYGIPTVSTITSSVYDHCIRAIEKSLKVGEHGIPLMGCGDWNDGMSTVGNKGKGESVWVGWFLNLTLKKFSVICNKMQDYEREKRYLDFANEIVKAIEENAWDGEWYRRAYFDDGTPLGSIKNPECMIDSLAQSWSIISKSGDKERSKIAMNSVEKHLIKNDEGMILLFTPPFDNSDLMPGYIKGYVPGVRENGGQYTHASTWVINAFALMGEGDKAWNLFNSINPINHARTSIECATYKVEPYVMAADVYAVNPHIGRGGWTWYTGAAGWMYRVGIENILGIKRIEDKLYIDPCIPKDWEGFSIQYKHEDSLYEIEVKNPKGINRNVEKIILDDVAIEEKYLKLIDDKKVHKAQVILG